MQGGGQRYLPGAAEGRGGGEKGREGRICLEREGGR